MIRHSIAISLHVLLVLAGFSLSAQQKVSVDDFTRKGTFSEKWVTGINWMNNGKFYTALAGNKVVRYDITTGQAVETIVDGSSLETPLRIEGYSFSADESRMLLLTERQSIYRRSFVGQIGRAHV